MSNYVEIQIQSPVEGTGFVAQWYTGGERSAQAFALASLGELLFLAFFVEAPMLVADDTTRAMLARVQCNRRNRRGQLTMTTGGDLGEVAASRCAHR